MKKSVFLSKNTFYSVFYKVAINDSFMAPCFWWLAVHIHAPLGHFQSRSVFEAPVTWAKCAFFSNGHFYRRFAFPKINFYTLFPVKGFSKGRGFLSRTFSRGGISFMAYCFSVSTLNGVFSNVSKMSHSLEFLRNGRGGYRAILKTRKTRFFNFWNFTRGGNQVVIKSIFRLSQDLRKLAVFSRLKPGNRTEAVWEPRIRLFL